MPSSRDSRAVLNLDIPPGWRVIVDMDDIPGFLSPSKKPFFSLRTREATIECVKSLYAGMMDIPKLAEAIRSYRARSENTLLQLLHKVASGLSHENEEVAGATLATYLSVARFNITWEDAGIPAVSIVS